MAKYTVSMRVDGRVDVEVEADSFEDAFVRARNAEYDPEEVEVVDFDPVNATDEHGTMRDFVQRSIAA